MSYAAAERSPIDIDEFERRLRGPAPRSSADPLAELARLVTPDEAKQPEALDALFARSSREAAPHAGAQDFHSAGDLRDGFRFDEMAVPAAENHGFAPDAFDSVFDQNYPREDRYAGASEQQSDEWQTHADERMVQDAAAPRSKRPLYATAAVIAVGLLGIGGTFAFKGHRTGSDGLVEVKAAPGPTKVQAQAAAADSNSSSANSTVLDRGVTPPPVTRVVDRQEQPVDLKEAARAPRNASLSPSTSERTIASIAGEGTGSVFAEPRKVKTVSVRPDGTIMGTSSVDRPTPPSSPAQANPATQTPQPTARNAATPKTVARVVTPAKPAADKPLDTAAKPVSARADATPKPVAAKPAKPTQVARAAEPDDDNAAAPSSTPAARQTGGGFAVQLAAPGSEAEARSMATRLGQKFSGELGGARVTVQKASDKAVYRVRTATMSHEEAISACEKIKAAGGSCFVAKN